MMQTTIRKSVKCSGIGMHSGRKVGLTFRPAAEGAGVVFVLRSEAGTRFLTPTPEDVIGTGLATTLGTGEHSVSTVEHLMATVRGLGIDNIQIEITGGEVPIMDGSAASFVFLLKDAGIRKLGEARKYLAVTKPFEHKNGTKRIKVEPYDGFRVDYLIDFNHPLIGKQTYSFEMTPESFSTEIAKARTFGFLKDVELLQKNGLGLGGSLDNAIVLDEYGVINDEGLRFDDEFVRHKILDFIGDMAISQLPLLGRFTVSCSGHAFNNEFLRTLMANSASCLQVTEEGAEPLQQPVPETEEVRVGLPAMA